MLISYTFMYASVLTSKLEITEITEITQIPFNFVGRIFLTFYFRYHCCWFCCCCCITYFVLYFGLCAEFSCLIPFVLRCFCSFFFFFLGCFVEKLRLQNLPSYVSNYENAKLLKGKWNAIHNFWRYHKRIKRKFWQCNFQHWNHRVIPFLCSRHTHKHTVKSRDGTVDVEIHSPYSYQPDYIFVIIFIT